MKMSKRINIKKSILNLNKMSTDETRYIYCR